jgi:hypothetical protein
MPFDPPAVEHAQAGHAVDRRLQLAPRAFNAGLEAVPSLFTGDPDFTELCLRRVPLGLERIDLRAPF